MVVEMVTLGEQVVLSLIIHICLTIYEVIESDIHRSVLGPDGRLCWWVVGFLCTEWAWGVPWLDGGIRMEDLLTFECIHVV